MGDGTGYREVVGELVQRRKEHCFPLRIRSTARKIAEETLAILFPHFSETTRCDGIEVVAEISMLEANLMGLLADLGDVFEVPNSSIVQSFLQELPAIHQMLSLDARAIHAGDPAAKSIDEVILTYPGFLAVSIYRIAHSLYTLGFPLLPRLLTEHAHRATGIDIHPGATIGRNFFIDHGTGVVIGETAEIGNGVKLYQGVTIGALVVEKNLANIKRHPTIEDNVVVYANATILGGRTTVGHDSVIGGNAWITESIPPFSMVGRLSEVRPRRSNPDGELEYYI